MIRKQDVYQVGILVVIVMAFSFVMLLNDYNQMEDDLISGNYTVYDGRYSDFKEFEEGLTIAENGVVYRNVYMGYINNTIVDNSFMEGIGTHQLNEDNLEILQSAKWETILKMVFLHFHYVMAVLVYLMYRLVDYLLVGLIGANNLFIKHKGDISDNNFQNVMQDFKYIYDMFYNKMQVVVAIMFGLVTTFIIRMAANLDDYRLVILTIIGYTLVSVINYILKIGVEKGNKGEGMLGTESLEEKKDKEVEDDEEVEEEEGR